MKQETGEEVDVEWRPFSLDQVNQKVGEDYLAWDEPDENLAPALWGHRAGIAAKRQGKEALQRFMPLLLKARHIDRLDLSDKDALKGVAKEAGLDLEQFAKDLEDRSTLDEVAASHQEAVNELGIFGTPTLVFPNGGTSFLKMSRLATTSKEQAARAFHSVMDLMEGDLFIGEVKRPQPPWPKGVPD